MDPAEESVATELRQSRLSKLGRVMAAVTLGYSALIAGVALWLERPSFNLNIVPILVAGSAFAALWLLLRGPLRSARFVRGVELSTLFVATTALSSTALIMDLTASPEMTVRSILSYVLLVYAVYVPSSAKHTLKIALIMTLPLLVSVFVAYRAWDPALHDPPAAIWPKAAKGDMAIPITLVSASRWLIVVGIAAGFSHTIYGLQRTVHEVRKLGQYTLEEKIGEGGMGVVYRASHMMLRRPTAIKLLPADRAGKAALARFEREVRRTAMLTHPNTVTVFDYGRTADGVVYYAMELLEGVSLDEMVETIGPQPEARVIHLLDQVAASLAEAHGAGLIHRDIKPGNIVLLDRGGISDLVKVVDFGLVKEVSARHTGDLPPDAALSAANTLTGTPMYMAPEAIVSPDAIDARADIYALGAVGYWLLTGTHVFGGSSVLEVCVHHLHSLPTPPSERLRTPVAADLEAVILDCLAKNPEARPTSAQVLRERLRACAGAGQWSNDEASAWWSRHRGQLRSGPAHEGPPTSQSQDRVLTLTII